MTDVVTIALAKGRLAEQALSLLEGMGIDCSEPRHPGRQLVLWDKAGCAGGTPPDSVQSNLEHRAPACSSAQRGNIRFILVKPSDVPVYVDHGVADLGVVGKDTLLEAGRPLYEVLDLGFGACRLCIAGYADGSNASATRATFRVATKYPNIAREYYAAKGQTIEIIELHGSVELGPVIGLSDVILDIVESGSTLRANGLSVLEDVCDVSARLVVNRVSLKTKRQRIREIIDGMALELSRMQKEAEA